MANEIFENIWKIMKENKLQYVGQINNNLICKICNKLMIKACHVPCGCRYCFDCITNYLDGKDKFCPGKSKFCQINTINHASDVVIDSSTNVRISGVVVKCPNKNCELTNELSLIENHMRTCEKNPKSCPYFKIGCKNDEVMIDEMKNHLCTEIFCHTKLLLDFINNLRNEFESMKNKIVELKSENKHLKQEIEVIKIESKNNHRNLINNNEEFEKKIKNNLSKIKKLNEEMVAIKNENRSLMDKLKNIEKSRINEVIDRMQRKSEQQTREIDEMKAKCKQTENKEIELRRIIEEIFDKNADLMKKSSNYDEKINNLQIKTIKLERITEKINFGKLAWKIVNFSQQQRGTFIYSESFYSHENGYKMCLSVWIYWDIFGDVLVDVHFNLMRGEFDNDLLWPFKHGVRINIINQKNEGVYESKSIKYDDDPNINGWNKPTTERNDGICFFGILGSEEIILNDQLLIKCKINI